MLRIESVERSQLLQGLETLWEQGRFCDLTLASSDGAFFEAHRVVVAAASEPLAALLGGDFAESSNSTVALDAPASSIILLLQYLYKGGADIELDQVSQALKFAHMYALHALFKQIEENVSEQLGVCLALSILVDCRCLGLQDLDQQCEQCVAKNFEQSTKLKQFIELSSAQIGRIIKHDALQVPSEEAVLSSLLSWYKAVPGRDGSFGALLQLVAFPLLSLPSLIAVDVHAARMGSMGIELQQEARRATKRHRSCDDSDAPLAKRRCLQHWWSGLGSSRPGGAIVADQLDRPHSIAVTAESIYVADASPRILRFIPGVSETPTVVGPARRCVFITCSLGGELYGTDPMRNCVFKCGENGYEIIGEGQWRYPVRVSIAATGAVYVLDHERAPGPGFWKVHKYSDGVVSEVATLPMQEGDSKIAFWFVCANENVYISLARQNKVLVWKPASRIWTTVAGGSDAGEGLHQLKSPGGIAVDTENSLYIADSGNDRVVKWHDGANKGVVVAGGYGAGNALHQLRNPVDVKLGSQNELYVAEVGNGRVTRWGPPLSLNLD